MVRNNPRSRTPDPVSLCNLIDYRPLSIQSSNATRSFSYRTKLYLLNSTILINGFELYSHTPSCTVNLNSFGNTLSTFDVGWRRSSDKKLKMAEVRIALETSLHKDFPLFQRVQGTQICHP